MNSYFAVSTDTWRATNAGNMATNSGQPGDLLPCKFTIPIRPVTHHNVKIDIKKRLTYSELHTQHPLVFSLL